MKETRDKRVALCVGGVADGEVREVEGHVIVVPVLTRVNWTLSPSSDSSEITFHKYELQSIHCGNITFYVYVLDSLSLQQAIRMLVDSYAASNNKDE